MDPKLEQQLMKTVGEVSIKKTSLSFGGRSILPTDPEWAGVRMNRIASLGSEMISTQEQIAHLSNKKESKLTLPRIKLRLEEIRQELKELGAVIDKDGFISSSNP